MQYLEMVGKKMTEKCATATHRARKKRGLKLIFISYKSYKLTNLKKETLTMDYKYIRF